MCPDNKFCINNHGFGLLAAIFVVFTLAIFGLLLTRYTVTSQTTSTEDQIWAQALYSAEAVMKLNILSHDGGGGLGGGTIRPTNVQGFDFSPLDRVTDNFPGIEQPSSIRVRATHAPTAVSREVEAKYIL